jgi:hypothetical protein
MLLANAQSYNNTLYKALSMDIQCLQPRDIQIETIIGSNLFNVTLFSYPKFKTSITNAYHSISPPFYLRKSISNPNCTCSNKMSKSGVFFTFLKTY